MEALRRQVLALIRGGQAYDRFDEIVGEFAPAERGQVPPGGERSPWQILEHMRLAQRDILDYCRNEDGSYRDKAWPDEYWPAETEGDWDATVQAFLRDRTELERLVADPGHDLLDPFRWESAHTLLREALLAADHNSHHLGQLVELKRWLGSAPGR